MVSHESSRPIHENVPTLPISTFQPLPASRHGLGASQISSLIETASLTNRKFEEFDKFYPLLRNHLRRIPPSEPVLLQDSRTRLQKSGIRIPLSDPIDNVKWTIGFIPPQQVDVIGSWSLKNGISSKRKQHATIDLLIQIPAGVLQEKDYLSKRYFHKRAHYLAHIAKSFLKSSFSDSYEFAYSYLEGDSFKPVITIQPQHNENSFPRWTARLILSYHSSVFPISKLAPTEANLQNSKNPTPHYNQSILMDCNELNLKFHSFFSEISTKYSAFNPTCQLIKLWAQRKVFYRQIKTSKQANNSLQSLVGFGRFGWFVNFLVANVLLGTAQARKKVHLGDTILQSDPAALFKKVIDWLADWNLETKIVMHATDFSHRFCDGVFDAFETVLIDPTGLINLTARIPMGTLKLLCASAQKTASHLKSDNDVFAAVFRGSYSFASSFDYHFIIRISDEDVQRLCQEETIKTIHSSLQVLSRNLQTALGDRVKGFAVLCQFLDASVRLDKPFSKGLSDSSDSIVVQVGLVLDPQHAFNLATISPSPEPSPELDKFLKFWGPRADLCRFANASIQQAVQWHVSDPLERMQIVKQIVRWLLIEKLKFKDDRNTVWDLISDFDSFIFENSYQMPKIYQKDPRTIGFLNVKTVFDEFVKQLKSLKDDGSIPLLITSVLPVSEYLRFSSVFIPGPRRLDTYQQQQPTTKYLPSICCQLRFESCGKWPENLEEIQHVKTALLCKIASSLQAGGYALDCKLQYDYDSLPITHNVALDVLHSSGYAFKLIVCYEREEMLLKEALEIGDQDRTIPLCKTTWIVEALQHYRRDFVESRAHHDMIVGLQTRFPSYTYTVRLIKRWFSSHMLLSTHISIELVELLASVVYLLPADELLPTTGISGFVRFLNFLKSWDWRQQPLLLPLQASVGLPTDDLCHFPMESLKIAVENFDQARKKDPGFHQATYFVATENDLSGSQWMSTGGIATDKKKKPEAILRPSRLIADRIQALASASFTVLESTLESGLVDFKPLTIFKSPSKDYDFHLLLDLSCYTRLHQSIDADLITRFLHPSNNMDLAHAQSPPEIDHDPILGFVKELQVIYGDWIEFFYDQYGGPQVAGVLNRALLGMDGQGGAIKFTPTQINYLTKPIIDEGGSIENNTIDPSAVTTTKTSHKKGTANGTNKRKKVVFDLDSALFDIFNGIGSGLVVKILKKGIDY